MATADVLSHATPAPGGAYGGLVASTLFGLTVFVAVAVAWFARELFTLRGRLRFAEDFAHEINERAFADVDDARKTTKALQQRVAKWEKCAVLLGDTIEALQALQRRVTEGEECADVIKARRGADNREYTDIIERISADIRDLQQQHSSNVHTYQEDASSNSDAILGLQQQSSSSNVHTYQADTFPSPGPNYHRTPVGYARYASRARASPSDWLSIHGSPQMKATERKPHWVGSVWFMSKQYEAADTGVTLIVLEPIFCCQIDEPGAKWHVLKGAADLTTNRRFFAVVCGIREELLEYDRPMDRNTNASWTECRDYGKALDVAEGLLSSLEKRAVGKVSEYSPFGAVSSPSLVHMKKGTGSAPSRSN